jgi:hypothetical protein
MQNPCAKERGTSKKARMTCLFELVVVDMEAQGRQRCSPNPRRWHRPALNNNNASRGQACARCGSCPCHGRPVRCSALRCCARFPPPFSILSLSANSPPRRMSRGPHPNPEASTCAHAAKRPAVPVKTPKTAPVNPTHSNSNREGKGGGPCNAETCARGGRWVLV